MNIKKKEEKNDIAFEVSIQSLYAWSLAPLRGVLCDWVAQQEVDAALWSGSVKRSDQCRLNCQSNVPRLVSRGYHCLIWGSSPFGVCATSKVRDLPTLFRKRKIGLWKINWLKIWLLYSPFLWRGRRQHQSLMQMMLYIYCFVNVPCWVVCTYIHILLC